MRNLLLKLNIEKLLTLGYFSKIPQKQLVYGYLSYMIIGTILLCLPFAQKEYTSIIDNFFTSVSAVSTTGLCTISVADNYTLFGQIIVLILIQLGGLGYITLSSYLVLRITRHFTTDENSVLSTEFTLPQGMTLQSLVRSIVTFTFIFEFLGAIALFFIFHLNGAEQPIWKGIFHSISAFCTAGFRLYNDSFEQFKFSAGANSVISILSFAGGLGFIVLLDFWRWLKIKNYKITFTSKVILLVSLLLTIFGTVQIFIFEPSIQNLDDYSKLTVSFFQTMTAMTTVGFNTIPISTLHSSTLMVIVVLMFIGASPSGTGGGLKSTTFTAVWSYIQQKLSLSKDVTFFGNKIPDYRVQSALTTFIFYTAVLFLGTYILTFTENANLMQLLFESGSALGTVGLSTGITGSLTSAGKFVIIGLMFLGRVGVITFGNAVLVKHHKTIKDNDIAV